MKKIKELEIIKPDDLHLHLRDGEILRAVLPFSENVFARGLIMPNLNPPITSSAQAESYKNQIIAVSKNKFQPKMAIYLTAQTSAQTIIECAQNSDIIAVKWYPTGATTNSEYGVSAEQMLNDDHIQEVISAMIEKYLVLSIHGEVVDNQIDIFSREQIFLDQILLPLLKRHPRIKICLEHVSSKDGIEFIYQYAKKYNISATITCHHLAFNRNDLLVGTINPHYYCLPILKTEEDRKAIVNAAVSGNPSFFLGTDSAPHLIINKESASGCAGCFSAPVAMSIYTQVFEQADKISRLENFCSKFGADFYGLESNKDKISLLKNSYQVPTKIGGANNTIIPLMAGETLMWQVES